MKSKIKTTLVNHGGIIQDKFLIKNMDDVRAYNEINAAQHGYHLFDFSSKPNRVRDTMKDLAMMHGDSMLIACAKMADAKIMAIQKQVLSGRIVVANLAGGWMLWDDRVMSIVDESERKDNDSEYLPKVNIGSNKVLVLENQERISDKLQSFVKNNLEQSNYSSIVRLNTDHNNQIGKWLTEAIQNGHDTIVAETSLTNIDQIKKLATMMELLPPLTFHLFVYSNTCLDDIVCQLIGEEKTNTLFKKHTIITY